MMGIVRNEDKIVLRKLSTICTISNGFSFRESVNNSPTGGVFVIQAANLPENGHVLDHNYMKQVKDDAYPESVRVKNGDILLVSRGTASGGFRAVYVVNAPKSMIASSSVHILRVTDTQQVDPEFLAAYLNSSSGQQGLQRIATGSNILTLMVKHLAELTIHIPPMVTQQHIARITESIHRQRTLLQKRSDLLQHLLSATITHAIK